MISFSPSVASSTAYRALARAKIPMGPSRMWKVGKHPTRRRMARPRSNHAYNIAFVPCSASRRISTAMCWGSCASGTGASCKAPIAEKSKQVGLAGVGAIASMCKPNYVGSTTAWASLCLPPPLWLRGEGLGVVCAT